MFKKNQSPAETIGDVVFRQIRQDIISGDLLPGSKIKLEQTKERYEISIPSLREILSRLAMENLVVAEGQRGFEVSPVSRQELNELADLRIVLETHALGLAFVEGDIDWEGRIVAAHYKLAAAERKLLSGDASRTIDWVRYDWEFHHAIVSACNSSTLMATLSSVFDRFLRYHLLAKTFRGAAVVSDHKLLFDAALKRDVESARTIVRKHIMSGVDHVLKSGFLS
ncbi:GntR family transcriptional regulator [Agrobacterium rubi]|uniref:GntR family transcriptional regulator n=1 Tax=Agrobacterium rubi TaxID=28099 RepID=A0AAE7RC29_9HYPH|nr:GntR family transcriptional regulator [Agrobacterium rubi]MCL6652776.1 GntR family transcriptional regulator [Agrobacterium rubi]NTE88514.1 GntR family transcriptional regulator [Agrobacterium rubi]NTF04342.1 GntR family transcriptional regulator [Agrobacterium rubi]NTF09875.1 GntR family transcriptional regulator [Agrobacterium rubi]NTF21948.1 GntR family transcriptional regulator [Agrobacterium rubi]